MIRPDCVPGFLRRLVHHLLRRVQIPRPHRQQIVLIVEGESTQRDSFYLNWSIFLNIAIEDTEDYSNVGLIPDRFFEERRQRNFAA